MRKLLSAGLAFLAALIFVSCDETTDKLGFSVVDSKDVLSVSVDTFHVTSSTLAVDSVIARNFIGYLGHIKDPETGNAIKANFMAQLNVLEGYAMPTDTAKTDSLGRSYVKGIVKDSNGLAIADSCEIRLYFDKFFGDSLAPMKLTVMELEKPLEETTTIYSNFDPEKGYVRTGGLQQSRTYTLADNTQSDSLNIRIRLNKPYTDKNGKTYNNFGSYLLQSYYANPKHFSTPYLFLHNVVPGFYFKIDDGVGSMAYVSATQLNFFFRYQTGLDSIGAPVYSRLSSSLTSTEEVLQATTISNDNDQLQQMAADGSCTYLKSPAGLFTELTLPIDDIMRGHENDTLNSVKLVLPCINGTSSTGYELEPSAYVLMLPKDSLNSFFASNSLPDSQTSFLCSYSSSNNNYTFSNFSSIVSEMYHSDRVSADWNKVVIVPVSVTTQTTSSSTSITKVSHNMSMSSTRLLGGTSNPNALSLSVVYSKFKEQ